MIEEKDALTGKERKVTLFATKLNYRTGMAYYLVPIWDSTLNKFFYGWEDEGGSKEQKILWNALGIEKEAELPEMQVPIHHGTMLNLSSPKDKAIYCLCLINPTVARSRKSVNLDNHLFYIVDQETEDVEEVNSEMKILDAKMAIKDLGDIAKMRACAIFLGGINVNGLSLTSLQNRLFKEATIRPDDILEFFAGKNPNALLVKELAYYDIIRMRQGVYYDGEVRIGTFPEAVDFMSDPSHSETVNSLGIRLMNVKDRK